MSKSRTPGVDLAKETVFNLFDNYVPLASCKPHDLWKIGKASKTGLTSAWNTIEKHYNILSDLLDAGDGHIAKHKSLHTHTSVNGSRDTR